MKQIVLKQDIVIPAGTVFEDYYDEIYLTRDVKPYMKNISLGNNSSATIHISAEPEDNYLDLWFKEYIEGDPSIPECVTYEGLCFQAKERIDSVTLLCWAFPWVFPTSEGPHEDMPGKPRPTTYQVFAFSEGNGIRGVAYCDGVWKEWKPGTMAWPKNDEKPDEPIILV